MAFWSLVYNEHMSWGYTFDTLMEPAFWFVDRFTLVLGPMFVVGVIVLTTSVIAIAYVIGLPYYLEYKSRTLSYCLVVFGQYLKMNVVVNYWRALTTHPGKVPSGGSTSGDDILKQVTSICKKCIGPKPPRTHTAPCAICASSRWTTIARGSTAA